MGSGSCEITHATGATICYGIGSVSGEYHTRDRGYDLLLALGSASCEITHEAGGTICCWRWVLHFVISHTKDRGLRFVMGIEFCIWTSHTGAGVRFVTGIGLCILRYHSRDRRYDLLRALRSASCELAYETAGARFVTGIGLCAL